MVNSASIAGVNPVLMLGCIVSLLLLLLLLPDDSNFDAQVRQFPRRHSCGMLLSPSAVTSLLEEDEDWRSSACNIGSLGRTCIVALCP